MLYYSAQGKTLQTRFYDMLHGAKPDTRTGEQIVKDTMERAGLTFGGSK